VRLTTDNSLWRGDGAVWQQISVGVASDGSSSFPGPVKIAYTLPVGAPANSLGVGGNLYVTGPILAGTGSAINGTAIGDFAVVSTVSTTPRGITSAQFSTDTSSARFNGYKARGTQGAPTTVVTGDFITRWSGWCYDGTNFLECSSIVGSVEGTVAAGRTPGRIDFATMTDAATSVLTTRMSITSSGNVGIGTTSPSQLLTVGSNNQFTISSTGALVSAGQTVNGNSVINGYLYAGSAESHFWNGTYSDPVAGTSMAIKIGAGGLGVNGNAIFNGNVGIGMIAPMSVVQINNGFNVVPATSGNMTTGLIVGNSTNGVGLNLGARDTGNGATSYVWLQGAFVNGAGTHENMALQPNGGNVGIGTTAPQAGSKLEVVGIVQTDAQSTDPGCTAVADIGKMWFDNTTTTTARKGCNNVAGVLTWVAF